MPRGILCAYEPDLVKLCDASRKVSLHVRHHVALGPAGGPRRCPALITSSLVDLGLLVQNRVQQGTVDFNVAVVVNKTQFPKSVHEKAHARSRRADHLRQCLLADFRYDWLRPTFLAKIRQKQKGPCQPFLARRPN
jgi:hypothetical protein